MNSLFRCARTIIAALVLLGASHAYGAEPLRLEHQLPLVIQNSQPIFADGMYYAAEPVLPRPLPGSPQTFQFTSTNLLTGEKERLGDATTDEMHVLFVLPDYVLARVGNARAMTVLDRKTGAILGARDIGSFPAAATVKDGTLLLLQRANYTLYVTKFALPGLEPMGEDEAVARLRLETATMTDERVIGFRRTNCGRLGPCPKEFVISTLQGDVTATIPLAIRQRPGRNCGQRIDVIAEARAVVALECGQYAVIDLEKGAILYELPADPEADFLSVAVTDGILFTRSSRNLSQASDATRNVPIFVLDLQTGRELAKLNVPGGKIAAAKGRLIVLPTQSPPLCAVYAIDKTALYDERIARRNIADAVQRAGLAPDVYRALAAMESVSLSPILVPAPHSLNAEDFGIALRYGRYLALSPWRAKEGAALLAKLAASRTPDLSLQQLSEAASRRAQYFDANAETRERALSQSWAPASERPLMGSVIARPLIDFGHIFETIYFHDTRAFVPYWNGAVKVEVYDRADWHHLVSIPIMDGDGVKQQNIKGITSASGRLFVSIQSRYAGQDDLNLYVFDLQTLEKITAIHVAANGPTLIPGKDAIGLCDYMEFRSCSAIGATTLEPVATQLKPENARYISRRIGFPNMPGSDDDLAWDLPGISIPAERTLVQANARYSVSDATNEWPRKILEFRATNGVTAPFRFPLGVFDLGLLRVLFTDDGASAIIGESSLDMARFHAFDFANQESRILLELPVHYYKGAVTDGRTLFLAWDRTVMAIDMRTGDILDSVDPYDRVAGEPQTRRNEIETLFIADGRLVVMAPGGPARVFDLKRFYERAKPGQTPFASTASILALH